MESTIRISVLSQLISIFIHIASSLSLVVGTTRKIIIIDKVIASVIWRVDIYHLHLTIIGLLQELQHFEVVTLYVEVLRGVPVHGILFLGAQGLIDGASSLCHGFTLACPCELVAFTPALHSVVAKETAQRIYVHGTARLACLGVERLGECRRDYLIKLVE